MMFKVLYNISCLHSGERNNSFWSQKICVHFRSNGHPSVPVNFFSHLFFFLTNNNLLLIFNYFWSTDSETVRLPYEVSEFYSFCWFCKMGSMRWLQLLCNLHWSHYMFILYWLSTCTIEISGIKRAYILSFLKKEMNCSSKSKNT